MWRALAVCSVSLHNRLPIWRSRAENHPCTSIHLHWTRSGIGHVSSDALTARRAGPARRAIALPTRGGDHRRASFVRRRLVELLLGLLELLPLASSGTVRVLDGVDRRDRSGRCHLVQDGSSAACFTTGARRCRAARPRRRSADTSATSVTVVAARPRRSGCARRSCVAVDSVRAHSGDQVTTAPRRVRPPPAGRRLPRPRAGSTRTAAPGRGRPFEALGCRSRATRRRCRAPRAAPGRPRAAPWPRPGCWSPRRPRSRRWSGRRRRPGGPRRPPGRRRCPRGCPRRSAGPSAGARRDCFWSRSASDCEMPLSVVMFHTPKPTAAVMMRLRKERMIMSGRFFLGEGWALR